MDEDEKHTQDESEDEKPDTTGEQSAQPSSEPQQSADYASILQMLTDMQANQDELAGQIERISDAQSMILGAGAVIHESGDVQPGTPVKPPTDDDYVPLDKLNLSI